MRSNRFWVLVITLAVVVVVTIGFFDGYLDTPSPKEVNVQDISGSISKEKSIQQNPLPLDKPSILKSAEKFASPPQPLVNPPPPNEKMQMRMGKDMQNRVASDLLSGAFFRALNQEDQNAIVALLTEAEMAKIKLLEESFKSGRPPTLEQMKAAEIEASKSVRSIVGDAVFSEYQEHMENRPHRSLVNMMNQDLAVPLDQANSDALITILAEEGRSLRTTQGGAMNPEAARSEMEKMAARAIERASEVLDPAQVEALKSTFDNLMSQKPPRK